MLSIENIKKTDNIIIDNIYANLLDCFTECASYCEKPYENVCGLIFHEAMIFYSALFYAKIWNYDINDGSQIFNNYPYLGYRKHMITDLKRIRYASFKMKSYHYLRNTINNIKLKISFFNKFDVNTMLLFFIILLSFVNIFVVIYSSEVRKFLNIWEW